MYNYLECKPIFNKKNLIYQRNEKKGITTFISKHHPELQALEMNEQTNNILNLCDGKKSINEISNKIKSNYSNVTLEEVQEDITNIIFVLWRIGIVEWNGEHAFKNIYEKSIDNVKYKMLTEDEVIKLIREIDKLDDRESKLFHTPYVTLDYILNISSARQRVFHATEEYFRLDIDSKSILTLALATPLDARKSLTLTFYIENEKIPESTNIDEFIKWCVDTYKKLTGIDFTRIDIQIAENNYRSINKFIERTSFKELGIMKDAIRIEDVFDVSVKAFDII
ncbi:PqqD family protein [Clostridium sardiniense]|uniref:PqqD family protein n=1 Tax=Clostridium sardiniense TaxID=29369 RepID=UPI001959E4A7|nr:PqqD family protein [Clostridium sardiniense]MBM7836237.1 hypothetical protein [Clostridium sardiniense]